MSLEYPFSVDNTVIKNIIALSSEQSVLEERRICELSELAYQAAAFAEELMQSGMDVCGALSILADSLDFSFIELHNSYLEENLFRLTGYLKLLGSVDKAYFSELINERLKDRGFLVNEKDFLPDSDIKESFVYVKNTYADEAYDVFSQEFYDPRVRYVKDFKEALSLVSSGDVGHCLLPLEDRGVRIKTVEELIYKGDFKINSVTPVFGFDGNADMKYCIVSKDYMVAEYFPDDDRYLELRISRDNDTKLSELLFVGEYFGLEAYRVNFGSILTEDGESFYCSLIFKTTGKDFTRLLTYLTLFTGDCTTLGIYKNLE